MDKMGTHCTDCRTVYLRNDKMSAEHSRNSEVILIPPSGVCNVAYSYKWEVLTSLNKVSLERHKPMLELEPPTTSPGPGLTFTPSFCNH